MAMSVETKEIDVTLGPTIAEIAMSVACCSGSQGTLIYALECSDGKMRPAEFTGLRKINNGSLKMNGYTLNGGDLFGVEGRIAYSVPDGLRPEGMRDLYRVDSFTGVYDKKTCTGHLVVEHKNLSIKFLKNDTIKA